MLEITGGLRLEGASAIQLDKPLAEAGLPRAVCAEPDPDGFWVSPAANTKPDRCHFAQTVFQRAVFVHGTRNALPAATLELVDPVGAGTTQLPTSASPTPPSEGLPRALLTPQGNYFALQKCEVCEAEASLETLEGKAALGYEGGILQRAVASLPAFKRAAIKENDKTFPSCKHVSVYLPFKELNKVTGFNKLESESNEKALGQILLESNLAISD